MSEPLGNTSLLELVNYLASLRVAQVQTSLPAKVLSFDGTANPPRCTVKLAVREPVLDDEADDGSSTTIDGAIISDCPVLYPAGGGASVFFPLSAGDEVTCIFSSRDTDNAIEAGEDQNEPASLRRHHLMDAFVVPSPWSVRSAIAKTSQTDMTIEAPTGSTFIKLGDAATKRVVLDDDVRLRLNAIEFKVNEIIGIVNTEHGSGIATLSLTTNGDIQSSKVKAE